MSSSKRGKVITLRLHEDVINLLKKLSKLWKTNRTQTIVKLIKDIKWNE